MKKTGKFLSLFVVFTLLLNVSFGSLITQAKVNNEEKERIRLEKIEEKETKEFWKNYKFTDEDIKELEIALDSKTIEKAMKEIDKEKKGTQSVMLTENYELVVESNNMDIESSSGIFESADAATSYRINTYSTYIRHFVFNYKLVRCTLKSEFSYTGSSVDFVDAQDSSGTYFIGWSVSSSATGKNISSTLAKAKGSYDCKNFLGVAPVGMTIQTFKVAMQTYCNQLGNIHH